MMDICDIFKIYGLQNWQDEKENKYFPHVLNKLTFFQFTSKWLVYNLLRLERDKSDHNLLPLENVCGGRREI